METGRQAHSAAPFGSVGLDIATRQDFRHAAGRSDALSIHQDVLHIRLQHAPTVSNATPDRWQHANRGKLARGGARGG